METCVHHDDFIYNNHSVTFTQWDERAAIEQLLREEADNQQLI